MSAGNARRLDLDGDVTVATAADHHRLLVSFLAAGGELELGLSGVTDLDTAGLQLLLAARAEAEKNHATLLFHAPGPPVREIFAIAGLDPILPDAGPAPEVP